MIKISVRNASDMGGVAEYDITMEEMEKVMDAHCDKIMLPTLMAKSTLYFPNGRVVEYTYVEEDKCIYKRVGKIKKYETD